MNLIEWLELARSYTAEAIATPVKPIRSENDAYVHGTAANALTNRRFWNRRKLKRQLSSIQQYTSAPEAVNELLSRVDR